MKGQTRKDKRKQGFGGKNPMDIISRMLALEEIKSIDVIILKNIDANLVNTYYEDDGSETCEPDWETLLFETPLYYLGKVIQQIAAVKQAIDDLNTTRQIDAAIRKAGLEGEEIKIIEDGSEE